MKIYKYKSLLILCLIGLLHGCVANDPSIEEFPNDKVSFDYKVDGDYRIDYLIESPIKFINTSALSGECAWDFGDGSPVVTDPSPTHIYKKAGTYMVKLTVAGEFTIKRLLISDLFPTITLQPIAGGICEAGTTEIQVNVSLPNPGKQEIDYHWYFPEGTLDENNNIITESVLSDPGKLKFRNIGSQKIVLKTAIGDKGGVKRQLEDGVLNVQVGYATTSKTLYFAVKGGNLMGYKLIPGTLPNGIKNLPLDLGVKSGQHPFNILFNDSALYVLDCGKQYYYINDIDGVLGDGKISVVWQDGSKVETMLTNNGGQAFNDPFYGYIDATDNMLYYSDRNTGIRKIDLKSRNQVLTPTTPFWVTNDRLGYYKNGWDFGSITSNFTKIKGVWWWNKTYNGMGIFRFIESDITKDPVSGTYNKPAAGQIFPNLYIKSFVVDDVRGMFYFTLYDASGGFYAATLSQIETINTINVAQYKKADFPITTEGSANEYVYISQMVLDPEDGNVYFAYRSDDQAKIKTGIRRFNYTSQKVENVIDNVEAYGITINNRKSKLF